MVGTVVKAGTEVSHIRVGDRVGVGAQSDSCRLDTCKECTHDMENLCQNGWVGTYNDLYSDGSKSYGGYATYCRVPARFAFKIPDGLESREAAPMMCAGLTTYNALTNNGAGPAKRVGVVGIGGLGHFALLWASALGCASVVAISRTRDKEDMARSLGATHFVATETDADWEQRNAQTLDLIVCTVSNANMPLGGYLNLLGVRGQFIQIGEPEDTLPGLKVFSLIGRDIKVGGSVIGSPAKMVEMLDFAVKHKVHPLVEERKMESANEAVRDMDNGKARFRYVLTNP